MRNEPRFVQPEDFFNRFGIDLNEQLKSNSNISNNADIFLVEIEDRLMAWIDANTFRNVKWEELQGEQLEAWQKAILTQAKYVFRNGDITTDSGYDPEKGKVAEKEYLASIEICQAAIDYLKVAGLYNHVVTNKLRYTRFGR